MGKKEQHFGLLNLSLKHCCVKFFDHLRAAGLNEYAHYKRWFVAFRRMKKHGLLPRAGQDSADSMDTKSSSHSVFKLYRTSSIARRMLMLGATRHYSM